MPSPHPDDPSPPPDPIRPERSSRGRPDGPQSGDKSAAEASLDPAAAGPIPSAAVGRLSLYLRELRHLSRDAIFSISSHELGRRLGVSAAVVRRDLACLGQLGRRGVGYDVAALADGIRSALGADQVWNVALVGAGSLGTALLRYRGFSQQGFRLLAAFDVSPARIGGQIEGVPILDLQNLEATVTERQISLAILAVPAEAAQGIADRLARCAVAGILNFAPVTLRVGRSTCVANVDLASELQQLSFAVARRAASSEPKKKLPPRLNASGTDSVD